MVRWELQESEQLKSTSNPFSQSIQKAAFAKSCSSCSPKNKFKIHNLLITLTTGLSKNKHLDSHPGHLYWLKPMHQDMHSITLILMSWAHPNIMYLQWPLRKTSSLVHPDQLVLPTLCWWLEYGLSQVHLIPQPIPIFCSPYSSIYCCPGNIVMSLKNLVEPTSPNTQTHSRFFFTHYFVYS